MADKSPRRLLTAREVAEYAQLSLQGTYRRLRQGDIPAIKIGRYVRVDPRVLDRWIEGQRIMHPRRTRQKGQTDG